MSQLSVKLLDLASMRRSEVDALKDHWLKPWLISSTIVSAFLGEACLPVLG
jgi:hypothetical protein